MSLRIPTSFSIGNLKLNTINEATPGNIPATSPALRFGQLGQEVEIMGTGAPGPASFADTLLYDSTIGTLFPGIYQYVQLVAGVTNAARGNVAFVSSIANAGNYIVTTDAATAATLLRPVGIFLNVVTNGNYCWIQTSGLMNLQFASTVTNPLDGGLVKIVNQGGLGVGQQVTADLTTPSDALVAAYIRTGLYAAELPVNNTITRVWGKFPARLV